MNVTKNIDTATHELIESLRKLLYEWAEVLGLNAGEADLLIERLLSKSKQIHLITDEQNAAEQVTRVIRFKLDLMKFGIVTMQVLDQLAYVTAAFSRIADIIAEDKYLEEINFDKALGISFDKVVSLATPDDEIMGASAEDLTESGFRRRDRPRRFGEREP